MTWNAGLVSALLKCSPAIGSASFGTQPAERTKDQCALESEMVYLNVCPMMVALRETPEDFEIDQDWLLHIPSGHGFIFDPRGRARVIAHCDCALLAISPEQQRNLFTCFNDWKVNYWFPRQVNTEFASHFQSRSIYRQILIDLTSWLYRRLVRGNQKRDHHHEHAMIVKAE